MARRRHLRRIAAAAGLFVLTLTAPTARTAEAQTDIHMPSLEQVLVLPGSSDAQTDDLLARLEAAYASMDAEQWVDLFTDDVEQIDVPHRVHVVGRDAWKEQTERINAAHVRIGRIHHGRARFGDWIVVEIEWTGTVRGEALGTPDANRDYRYAGIGLLEVEDRKIRRQIIYGDVTTLKEQLGS